MLVFSPEVQRRVRLRNAKKFDLEPLLGEPVVVFVGEIPQAHQAKMVSFLQVRQELVAAASAGRRSDESPDAALARMGEELSGAGEKSVEAAQRLGSELSSKLVHVMQQLIAAALLDANGDRMSEADGLALFDLLPATSETAALLHQMSEAVLLRVGKSSKKPSAGEASEPQGK